jgi:Holliday junction DNA helicase RuvA
MIGKLKGVVDSIDLDSAIIDLGGVGYLVYCSSKTLQVLQLGQVSSLYIETHVREDVIKLFGFATTQEKEIFLLLQSVNGVGAKMSLNIISQIDLGQLSQAILTRNKELLTSVSGVGTKTAERIIIELKNKKIFSSNVYASSAASYSNDMQDAIYALISLGLSKSEAGLYVEQAVLQDPNMQINDIIKQALILRNK